VRSERFLKGGDETSENGGKKKWEMECSDVR
jgi:hypothetical protein